MDEIHFAETSAFKEASFELPLHVNLSGVIASPSIICQPKSIPAETANRKGASILLAEMNHSAADRCLRLWVSAFSPSQPIAIGSA
jgi:hypothetical protein